MAHTAPGSAPHLNIIRTGTAGNRLKKASAPHEVMRRLRRGRIESLRSSHTRCRAILARHLLRVVPDPALTNEGSTRGQKPADEWCPYQHPRQPLPAARGEVLEAASCRLSATARTPCARCRLIQSGEARGRESIHACEILSSSSAHPWVLKSSMCWPAPITTISPERPYLASIRSGILIRPEPSIVSTADWLKSRR